MTGTVNLLVLLIFCSLSYCEDAEYKQFMQTSVSQGLELFQSLEKVLQYFRNNDSSLLSKKILETFEKECLYMEDPGAPSGRLRKPFIVVDGNHRPSRDVVSKRLAKLLGGRFLTHPAPCLLKFLDVLPKGTLLKRTFYKLSLYAQAFNAKVHLALGRAVIMDGYWLDQLVFHLLQSFPRGPLPDASSPIYTFPGDLLRPDVIFYLNIPDNLKTGMTTRSPIGWKPREVQIYKAMQSRYPIVFQTLTGNYRTTMDAVYQHICEELAETRDIWPFRRHIEFDYGDQPQGVSNSNSTVC